MKRIGCGLLLAALLLGCSTTRKLGEDEVLYTGVKKIKTETAPGVKIKGGKSTAIYSPMQLPPNNPLYIPYLRTPLPTGLWVYNWDAENSRGIKKWLYKRLAKKPVLLQQDVNPELRVRVVENAARDWGHFGTKVSYEVLYNKRNPKKARLNYHLYIPAGYHLGEVKLQGWQGAMDTLVRRAFRETLLQQGGEYNINNMVEERERITTLLRNRGYYYFDPDYIEFIADSTLHAGRVVDVRIAPKAGTPAMALHPYRIRNVNLTLGDPEKNWESDTIQADGLTIVYHGEPRLRRRIAANVVSLRSGKLYTVRGEQRTQSNLIGLGIFKYTNVDLFPVDTLSRQSYGLLDVNVHAEYDLPVMTELEVDMATKSNNQMGPALSLGITHKNIFQGGENLTMLFKGSYEWQTQGDSRNSSGLLNSYELGLDVSLTVPRLVVPRKWRNEKMSSEKTKFQISSDILNRSKFFRMLSLSGSANYSYRSGFRKSHAFTPLKLTYTHMLATTHAFDSTMSELPALEQSFKDQFIPVMSYTYTYDRQSRRTPNNRFFWQGTAISAGNVLSGIHNIFGNRGEGKKLFGNIYSQFAKINSDLILYRHLHTGGYLATRVSFGLAWPYGNTKVLPYSEQYYVGGANSIRAFTIRTIGPGNYRPPAGNSNRLAYLDQAGELKFEANAEYRFTMGGSFNGAIFLDMGNIWLLRDDPNRPGGQFNGKRFFKDLALGTGAGIRYDLSFLILRLDVGIGLHAPFKDADGSGYFNVSGSDRFGYHLSVGYPF